MPEIPSPPPPSSSPVKFRVFFDYWNFQLTLNERVETHDGTTDERFPIDWIQLPEILVAEAANRLGVTDFSYEGTSIFTSYDPNSAQDRKYHKWATSWLDTQAGIQVKCFERRRKQSPRCPACHQTIVNCPHSGCGASMVGTTEKGVDTAIATSMIRLAWENAFEVGILASSDADLVPAVEFLDLKGFRIQAGFPPHGSGLSRACWATIDVFALRDRFKRS